VLRRAQDSLDRISTQIRQTAAEVVGGAADDSSVRAALDLLAADALVTLALLAEAESQPERLEEFATFILQRSLTTR